MFQLNNWFKRVLLSSAIFLAILLLAGTAFAATEINTVADLKKIGSVDAGWTMDDEYILMKNITITDSEWTAIGNNSAPFTGSFDGNGNAIILQGKSGNLAFVLGDTDFSGFGLFGNTEGAVFSNLLIHVKCNLTVPYNKNVDHKLMTVPGAPDADLKGFNGVGFGILIGVADEDAGNQPTTIKYSAVVIDSNVKVDATENQFTGGFIGRAENAVIQYSTVDCLGELFSNRQSLGGFVGGVGHNSGAVAGISHGNLSIDYSSFTGNIINTNGGAGGLVGVVFGSLNVNNSTSNVDILSNGNAGGVVGVIKNSSGVAGVSESGIRNTTVSGLITSTNENTGGVLGYAWNLNNINTNGVYIDNCLVTATISSTKSSTGGIIGSSLNVPVISIKNSKVIDSYISGLNQVSGVLGHIESGEFTIENSHAVNLDLHGSNYVGGIFGNAKVSDANVKDSTVTGTIIMNDDGDQNISNIGGVAGRFTGDNGIIETSFASVDISKNPDAVGFTANFVGGFIGNFISVPGTISKCYATGNVSANDWVGGFSGYLSGGHINNCYYDGSGVTGTTENVSGFVGRTPNQNTAKISNCYTTSSIGFIGVKRADSIIENCFYLADPAVLPANGVTGIVDADMKAFTTFDTAGWNIQKHDNKADPEATWTSVNTFMYPKLSWQKHYDDYVIEVASVDHLKKIASGSEGPDNTGTNKIWLPNAKYVQTKDISFTDEPQFTESVVTKVFTGIYDGQGNKIIDLDIFNNPADVKTITYTGLFAEVSNAVFKNIILDNINVTSESKGTTSGTGGLIGHLSQDKKTTTIENCYVTGEIYGPSEDGNNIGGLIGRVNSARVDISKSGSIVDIYGGINVGGLIGFINAGTIPPSTISNCYSKGNITANGYAGGLVGNCLADVFQSYATGTIKTQNGYSGGLIGRLRDGTVSECYATGKTETNARFAGGLIAYITNGTVENCYSTGSVFAYANNSNSARDGQFAGGLVGYVRGGENAGDDNSAKILNSYTAGSVVCAKNHTAGGLIGGMGRSSVDADFNAVLPFNLDVIDCLALVGNVTAESEADRLIGAIRFVDGQDTNNINILNSYVSDRMFGVFESTFMTIPSTTVQPHDYWDTFPGVTWSRFSTSVWEKSPDRSYALPILKWQTEIPSADLSLVAPVNDNRGDGFGSGTIIDGSASSTTTTSDSGDSETQTGFGGESQQAGPGDGNGATTEKGISRTFVFGGFIFVCLIVGGVLYFRYRKQA